MDKRVIFAVAGSGKTTYIIKQLSLDTRSLIITYTNNNYENLKNKILEKFGYFPENITLFTYFSFLYSFCYNPFLSYRLKANGINYNQSEVPRRQSKSDIKFYQNQDDKRFYSCRLAYYLAENCLDDIKLRLEKYFDNLFIDEVQDFAGRDFNFLKEISYVAVNILFVGDFYQHTFDTSRDGNVNQSLHKNYGKYKKKFRDVKFTIDDETLKKSYRCGSTVCQFITEKIKIEINSHNESKTEIKRIETKDEIDRVFNDKNIIKLFYKEHYKYQCFSENWGKSKGKEYNDVCVVLNKAVERTELNPQTKNKFYVACSRTKNNLYFIRECDIKNMRQV